jgi:hypothetical protein
LRNCANSLYICGAQYPLSANRINDLGAKKTGCESCPPEPALPAGDAPIAISGGAESSVYRLNPNVTFGFP